VKREQQMTAEKRLAELGLTLPPSVAPYANYVPYVREGSLLFVAGQAPAERGALRYIGRVGADLTEQEGYQSARLCALNGLAQIRAALGSLDYVRQVVSLRGFVNSANDFFGQAQVINGASDLMVAVFGEHGRHARAALGTSVLPMNMATEIELVVAVHDPA
jgi:enamine deaminase RidA (YjgF/YER057c/UK114 family)